MGWVTETAVDVSTCACGRPVDGAVVCNGCTQVFTVNLGDVPWHLEQLDLVIGRMTNFAEPYSSGGKAAETPPFINDKASDVRRELHRVLQTWALLVSEEWDGAKPLPDDTSVALSRYLLAAVEFIRQHDAGHDACDELADAMRPVRQIIDTPRNRTTFPVCPCPETDCPGEVRAYIPRADDDRPHLTCTAEPAHTWPGEQWLHFGKRVKGLEVA